MKIFHLKLHSLAAISTLLFFTSGCALGPLVSNETARSLRPGQVEGSVGAGQAGYVFKGSVGLTDQIDLGVHWESLSLGARAKYSFLSQEEGWSFAGALGYGASVSLARSTHTYIDGMSSYRQGRGEHYGHLRLTQVRTEADSLGDAAVSDSDAQHFVFSWQDTHFTYGMAILGSRRWLGTHTFVSAEGAYLFSLDRNIQFDSGGIFLVGVAFGFQL